MTTAFACVNTNTSVRVKSSSGGIFHLLASDVLNHGGVIFGARFDSEFNAIHSFTESPEELPVYLTSKYVQSKLGKAFLDVKRFLDLDRTVLFSGTPCQVSGLLAFLGDRYHANSNLLLVDFVCHGVPSPLVWKKYLEEVSGQKKVIGVNFRDKLKGWKNYSLSIDFNDGTRYNQDLKNDLYLTGFLKDLYLRPACYDCQFKGVQRPGDITMADFWHIDSIAPEFKDDNKGVSLVLVHSENGTKAFEGISPCLRVLEVDPIRALAYNTAATNSVKIPKDRALFFREFQNLGEKIDQSRNLLKLLRKSTSDGLFRNLLRKIKKTLLQRLDILGPN